MKKMIKSLTYEEMELICAKQSNDCYKCPLKIRNACVIYDREKVFFSNEELNKEIDVDL